MNLITYPDREFLTLGLADALAGELKNALITHEIASFAVAGGTTPGPVFDVLSGVDLDWARIFVVPTDERWVPGTHPRSNARLIKERLLVGKARHARFLPLYAEGAAPEEALPALRDALAPHLPLSVLLLGMGGDMHIASLFPGAEGLADALASDAPPLLPIRSQAAGEPRITLTAPVLTGAISTHILITGSEKRAAIEAARHLPPEEAPVRLVLGNASVHWAE
jgi:6-phosphogluconolactonase